MLKFGDAFHKVWMLMFEEERKISETVDQIIDDMGTTGHEYKAALNAAMLYTQSTVADSANGCRQPSQRSITLLNELVTNHAAAIRSAAAEFNTPPK